MRELNDAKVVDLIVRHIAAGRLLLEEGLQEPLLALDGEPAFERRGHRGTRAPSPDRARARAAPLATEPPAFPADVDALALAIARRQAAQSGVPFCEECVKRRSEAPRRAAQ